MLLMLTFFNLEEYPKTTCLYVMEQMKESGYIVRSVAAMKYMVWTSGS